MADEPYRSSLNRKYIRFGSTNPTYEDKLQNRINIDDQRPIGEAVEAARRQSYVPDTTKGRNNWKGVVISAEPVLGPEEFVHLSRYSSYRDLGSIKYIYRVYIPELHLFGEPPQFNLCNGIFDKGIENKIKMYPVVIADTALEGVTLEPSIWVNVSFLDSVNYEFGVITQIEAGITPYKGEPANKTRGPFEICVGSVQNVPMIPETDIKIKGEDKKTIVPSSLNPNELDQLVYNIVMNNGGDDIDFYLTRAFIVAESADKQFALSNTGCAGFGQFCTKNAGLQQSFELLGQKKRKEDAQRFPNPTTGRIKKWEGPTGTLYEQIFAKSSSTEDISKSLAVNFFGGSTSSFVKNKANRKDQQAAKDYINFLKTGEITPAMEAVLGENNITVDSQLDNLRTFFVENDPYREFLNSITRKSGQGVVLLPKADARFDGEKNILATFKYINNLRNKPTVRSNPYALYMSYNAGGGFQIPVMKSVLAKTNNVLNFDYPPRKFWNNEVFESVAREIPGKNPILRNENGGVGKYSSYIRKRGIFSKLEEALKRIKETYRAKISIV